MECQVSFTNFTKQVIYADLLKDWWCGIFWNLVNNVCIEHTWLYFQVSGLKLLVVNLVITYHVFYFKRRELMDSVMVLMIGEIITQHLYLWFWFFLFFFFFFFLRFSKFKFEHIFDIAYKWSNIIRFSDCITQMVFWYHYNLTHSKFFRSCLNNFNKPLWHFLNH